MQPRVIVVTGSSSGIGQSAALAFATLGDRVVTHGFSNRQGAEQTASQVAALNGLSDGSLPLMGDISDPLQAFQLVEQAFAWQGRVDGWIHCAGADVITGTASQLSFDEKLERLWNVDVHGTIRLSRLVAKRMLSQSPGNQLPSIVHLSWDQASQGMEGDSGEYFCTVKAAIAAFSASLAKTLAPHVRVNCVAPGWIRTEWGENVTRNAGQNSWSDRAIGESQLNRWGKPEDIANAITMLCDPKHEFIHGQTIAVNGGWQGMNTAPRCTSSIG